MAKKIPDISNYHHVTDWSQVKENCSFIIGRATQGAGDKTTAHLLNSVDRYAETFIKGCEKNKIPYFLYVYLDKGNELAQAKFMVKTFKDKVGTYFRGWALDVEAGNSAANVKEALDYISKQSDKCMLYTMYAQYTTYKSVIASRPKNCAWWEARYGENDGKYNSLYPAHDCDLHQFTSKGKCDGISGNIDLNRLTGTKSVSWFTKKEENKTSTTEKKTTDNYYTKYTGKSLKIDTVFKTIKVPSKYIGSVSARKPVATKNDITNYKGTASQNLKLISLAKKGKLKKV